MIKGPKTALSEFEEPSEEQQKHNEYQYAIGRFEGIPFQCHGIFDDLDNLKMLITFIGKNVVQQEAEYEAVYKLSLQEEDNNYPNVELEKAWHKKAYRPFTYTALFMLIQGLFETRLQELGMIIVQYGKLEKIKAGNGVTDLVKEFRFLSDDIEKFYTPIKIYNLVRNKVGHSGGYFKKEDAFVFVELEKFVATRFDISIHAITHNGELGDFSHRIEINNSAILFEYIEMIKNLFKTILTSKKIYQ